MRRRRQQQLLHGNWERPNLQLGNWERNHQLLHGSWVTTLCLLVWVPKTAGFNDGLKGLEVARLSDHLDRPGFLMGISTKSMRFCSILFKVMLKGLGKRSVFRPILFILFFRGRQGAHQMQHFLGFVQGES